MADNSIITKEDSKVGRPCKYETEIEPRLQEIYEWVKAGYTDYSIADQLGVHQNTLIRYRENNSNLSETYARARKERNNLVMNSMYSKAVGIEKTVPKAFKVKEVTYNEEGKKQAEIERLEYGEETIFVPPDVNAADLFLRNNDPDYKGPKSVEINNTTTNNFQLPEKLKEIEQLDKAITDLEKQLAVDVEAIPVD